MAELRQGRWLTVGEPIEFRDALCEYVTALRENGCGIVDTILTLRRTLADVPGSLLDRAVTWCITHYYAP